jgi:tRNA (guanine37-N1)-methyltransferase
MTFHIITIFPRIFDSYFNESIIKRAQEKNIIDIRIHDLRDWTTDKHKTVDDAPYGGGAGMILKVEPICKAVSSIKYGILKKNKNIHDTKYVIYNTKTILLSAKGKTWNQSLARKYSQLDNVVLVCGRYEGVDERVKKFVDEEISIGDYVLTGGEIPAMAMVDSISRLLPGVLGNPDSIQSESFSMSKKINPKSQIPNPKLLEYPHYTRPEVFEVGGKKFRVPKVLLSGNHREIEEWRQKKSKIKK